MRTVVADPYTHAMYESARKRRSPPGNDVPFAAATDAFGTRFPSGRPAPRPSIVVIRRRPRSRTDPLVAFLAIKRSRVGRCRQPPEECDGLRTGE
jgi:hypothetical protein